MGFLRKLFGKNEKETVEDQTEGTDEAQAPSIFYKCPHCSHILMKDSMMMKFAGAGTGVATVGGGCPDCRGSLNGEDVYSKCKYDITIEQIARSGYGAGVINNILAMHRSGKIQLTAREQRILENRRR